MSLKSVGIVLGCFLAALAVIGCQTSETDEGGVKTFMVGPAMADGVGVGPMTCLLVKQSPDAEYQLFYSEIDDFDYVPGFEYELKVRVTERENVPADASKFEYELVEVVSKVPTGLLLYNTAWKLKSYISVSGTLDPVVHNSQTFLSIEGEKVSGNAGANSFFGSVEVEGDEVEFAVTGSSMMMGTPELMAQENQFLKLLGDVEEYQIVGEELRLMDDDDKTVLVFMPRRERSLTSTEWRAVGINNGQGGVQSLVANTEVTISFSEDGIVSGNSGCNNFSGGYSAEDASVKIGPLAGTRKSGPVEVMEQETNFLNALDNATTYKIDGNALELRNAEDALQVKLITE